MKILKNIFENMVYIKLCKNTHLYSKILNLFNKENISKTLFIFKIYCG